jgi:hypothetical protein
VAIYLNRFQKWSSHALVLHAAMVSVRSKLSDESCLGSFDLSALAPYLNGSAVPWPQICELRSFAQRLLESENGDLFHAEEVSEQLLALTNDLAIWIVERYYRPESPAIVSQLAPDIQPAGLGYLLYKYCENERQWLDEDELGPFQRLFERWINAIWDGKIELPLPEEIQTIGQLIAWLSNRDSAHIPCSIRQTIRELAEQD